MPTRLPGRPGARTAGGPPRRCACLAVLACLAAVLTAGCSGPATGAGAAASPAATTSRVPGRTAVSPQDAGRAAGTSLVATARHRAVDVRSEPGGSAGRHVATLADPTATGGPLTFRVLEQRGGWVRVQLPQRPNGSSGWVVADDVTLTTTTYALVVQRRSHRLEVWRGGRLESTYPVGVGRSVTPTPGGTYYLTELLRQPSSRGPYGPYAFGLSAFSESLRRYAGGPGQLGLHGTDAPRARGQGRQPRLPAVTNDVITELARTLPLGTPVRITR